MTIIEKIKAEIERLYGKYETKYHETRLPYVEGLLDGFDLVEQFLSTIESEKPINPTLQEQPVKDYNKLYEDIAKSEWFKKSYVGKSLGDEVPDEQPVCEGLEEEIEKVCEDFVFPLYGLDDEFGRELINKIARHFAQWGAEHLKK